MRNKPLNSFFMRRTILGEVLDDEDEDYEDEDDGDDEDELCEEEEEVENSSPPNAPSGGKPGDDPNECKQQ